jgi:DNA-binding beta-propeller fold protein YncE
MKTRGFVMVSLISLVAAGGLGGGGYFWSVNHVRRWTGRADLGFVSCNHCHGNDLSQMAWAKPRPRHPAPAGLAVSPDGRRLYVALDDVDEVLEADAETLAVLRRARVAGGPFGLAVDAAGRRLFVACRHQDRVAQLNLETLQEVESVYVGMAPVAVRYTATPAGERLIVANAGSGDVAVLSLSPLREVARPATGREPFGVDVSPDGQLAFVVSRLAEPDLAAGGASAHPSEAGYRHLFLPAASELTLLQPATGRVLRRVPLESAHLSEDLVYVPARGWALAPLVKVRNLVPITQVANGWVMSSGLAVADRQGRVVQVPLDEANAYFADPAGLAVDPAGRRAYVASGGSDAISVVDLERLAAWLDRADAATRREAIRDLSLAEEYVVARLPTGRNPRHLALSPDGRRLYVSVRLEDQVWAVDTERFEVSARLVLSDGGARDPIRRGERVFTKAAHTFQSQFSCRSCHPDGHVDGLAYDFDGDGIGDNLLDNRTLQGIDRTAPFKWNGKNPSLQVQCGPRFARVLMRTDPIPPGDLEDLVTFLKSQPPARTRHFTELGKPLSPAAERGRQLFFATHQPDGTPIPIERQCQTCHRPPLFTNRLKSAVGTRGPRDVTDEFDTPHLLGIAASPPYLHDGRARTLEELWTTYQTNDLHGVSSYWSKHQLNDLIEYLKTL